MKVSFVNCASLVLVLMLFLSCNRDVKISKQHVSEVLQTLSSNEMMGRDAVRGSGIKKAADFISSEFDKIGLKPLSGQSDYLQRFMIYSLKPSQSDVVINGQTLSSDMYFGLLNDEEIRWEPKSTSVSAINDEDNFRDKFRQYSSDDKASLIVVDEAHKMWFHKYRSYYSRTNRSFELGSKPNDLFILHNSPVRSYDIHIKNEVEQIELFNVAGMIEGNRSDEIVLFSAHYDHIGVISPVNGDSIANGANDNASGVAAVVELARHFQSAAKPERTLYFVAFTAEEAGGYGSKYFSNQMDPDQITAMFNIEMIGKPAMERSNSAWITGFDKTDFGKIIQNSITDSSYVFGPDPYPNQNLFYRSDNATLARLGVPAHTISTTPIDVDQDYHTVSDEYSTLNIDHVTNTIAAIAKAAKVIVSGQETPSRISPDSLD